MIFIGFLTFKKDRMDSKEQKDDAPEEGDRLFGDSGGQHPSSHDRQSRTHGVADATSQGDAVGVLGGAKGYGRDLGPVSPFGQEGKGKGLDGDLRESALDKGRGGSANVDCPLGFLVVLFGMEELFLHLFQFLLFRFL